MATVDKAPGQTAPMSTSQQPDDVAHWIGRVKEAAANPASVTGPQPSHHRPWYSGFFDCFNPIETCLLTCCCSCVTFGRTHHRLHHSATLEGYSPVNATCIGFCASSCVMGNLVMSVLQRSEMNRRFGLQGDFVVDLAKAFCCPCCNIVQMDKEAEHQLLQGNQVVSQQPGAVNGMKEPVQTPQPV